jgi:hypothetical protein
MKRLTGALHAPDALSLFRREAIARAELALVGNPAAAAERCERPYSRRHR